MIHTPREAFRKPGRNRKDDNVEDMILEDIRGHVWKRYAGRFEVLAEEANLHPSTVENFAWGQTSPRFETVARMLAAMDMLELVKDLLRAEKPITRTQGKLKKPRKRKRQKKS